MPMQMVATGFPVPVYYSHSTLWIGITPSVLGQHPDLLPTTQGDIGLSVELKTGNCLSPGIRENSPKVELGHKGPLTSQSWATAQTYANVRPSTIHQSLANARTLPHDPPPTKWIEWTHYGDCPQSACNMPTLSARGPIGTWCQRIANVYPKEPEGGRCYADFPRSDCNTLLVYGDSFC